MVVQLDISVVVLGYGGGGGEFGLAEGSGEYV